MSTFMYGVISPISRVITSVSHLSGHVWFIAPFITAKGPPCRQLQGS